MKSKHHDPLRANFRSYVAIYLEPLKPYAKVVGLSREWKLLMTAEAEDELTGAYAGIKENGRAIDPIGNTIELMLMTEARKYLNLWHDCGYDPERFWIK